MSKPIELCLLFALAAHVAHGALLDLPVWRRESGLWWGNYSFLGPDGVAIPPTPFNASNPASPGFPYRYDQYTGFINITIVGDRFYQHNYFLYPAPPADFCARWANSTVKNVIGNGTCGITGYERPYEAFGSQYKDTPCMIGTRGAGSFGNWTTYTIMLDAQSLVYTTITSPPESIMYARQINSIPDANGSLRYRSQMSFDISAGASGRKTTISDYRELKVASADEWIALIKKYRELYNISAADQVQGGTLPMATTCLNPTACPTAKQFQDASTYFNETTPGAVTQLCTSSAAAAVTTITPTAACITTPASTKNAAATAGSSSWASWAILLVAAAALDM